MSDMCSGSFGEPGERPGVETFGATARCDACGHWVEIHPKEPASEPYDPAIWRLEAHEAATGRTMGLGKDPNPDADALMPRKCEKCGRSTLSLKNAAPDVRATCSDCGHTWITGRANDRGS